MADSRHLKRHSMPVAWPVKRKNISFITRPNPGSHKRKYVCALVILLRDILGYAKTLREAKFIAHNQEVLINGKRVKDIKTSCGIFDVVEIKETSDKFVVLLDTFGKLKLVPTKENELFLKISSKSLISGGKFQFNFTNGFNLLVDKTAFSNVKVGDSIIFDFVTKKIKSSLNLVPGSQVYIFDGNFQGKFAEVLDFVNYNGTARDVAKVKIDGGEHSTAKDYCFAVGTSVKDIVRFS